MIVRLLLGVVVMVLALPVWALSVVGKGEPVVVREIEEGDVAPAAGPLEHTLLDEKVDEIKRGKPERQDVADGEVEVLSARDVGGYKRLFKEARNGKRPDGGAVKNKLLLGYVQGAYLTGTHDASFGELNAWLKEYGELPLARKIYAEAQSKRARPKQVCSVKKVKQKVAAKKGKKARTKLVSQRSCKTVGEWGLEPFKPEMVQELEARKERKEVLAKQALDNLPEGGRGYVNEVWRKRVRGDYAGALAMLLQSGVRGAMGTDRWQVELVKVADYYHGKREWGQVRRAAEAAALVRGPERDEALWLAGFANYRLGNRSDAAELWTTLVEDEPAAGKHHARAAWWAAKAMGESSTKARALLAEGAKDKVSFYGQLCAERLGLDASLSWRVPEVSAAEMQDLLKHPAAKRGLALAQVGEDVLAQQELRMADASLPYAATKALAALAVKANLPATALQAGKALKEQGTLVPAALFPLAAQWEPEYGWNFDRALMLGIMRQESAFQPQIGSHVGAQGLMQIMPATAQYVARMNGMGRMTRTDLHDPETNLELAQRYLNYLAGKLDGNMLWVVAAYNGGIGNVERWLERGVTSKDDPVLWLESIPFDETRDYVEKVFANYWIYQQRLGKKAWSLVALAGGQWPSQWKAEVRRDGADG